MLYNDVMHPINIAWLVYDVLSVTISSFIPETIIRKRVKRPSRKTKSGEEEEANESEQDQRSHHHHHRSQHHRRSGSSSQPPSVNTSLNASAFASGELPPQVPHRSRSHSGGHIHSRRENSSTNTNNRRWRDWRSIDLTKQVRLLAHILRATPVALLHFLCQYKTDVATLPLLRFPDLNDKARSLLWFNEDAVFASGVVVAFTITRVLLYALQQYVRERLLFETNLVVRSLRSRRAWRNTFGWALTISAHTLTDPIAFSTVACMLLVRRGGLWDLREVKFTPAGVLAAAAVGCAGVFVDIVFTPVAVQLCQCGVVRVFDAAEYLLLRRYATEALEYEDDDDDTDEEYEDDHYHAIVDNKTSNNDNKKKNHNNGDVGDDINGSRHKNSHNDDKKEEGDDHNKSRNNHNSNNNSNNNSVIEEEEKRKERREQRRQQREREREHGKSHSHNNSREEMGGSNVNSEDENGTTERSHLSYRRHRTPSEKRESHNTSKSHLLTDDSDNERATHKLGKKGGNNSSIISSTGRPREKSKAERKREREERNGKARKAEERAILRAIIYRVVASLFAQCIVQHPLTVLSHMLYNRAVLHGVGLLTAYDAAPNEPLTLRAWLQFLRFSGRNKNYSNNNNNASGEQSSGVLIVEVLRSIGYFIGNEVSTVGGTIRNCSPQDAAIHALVEKAEQTRRNDNNSTGANIGNRALAMESAELMARSIASLSPLFTAFHFTAIDKLLGFYMAVWVRLNDK
ncbi:hypothetical protein LSM04_003299 [Trypanosoma melophagium]|uniref:uncharacterized protein n=1 Tax=Trypanosoma melophagium TaxID=715481 RepID=UPI00351A275C|nr:hypothetical protein LSM04_003299 [Trypanosoma melophagium]